MALHPVRRLNQIAFQCRSFLIDTAYFLHLFRRIIRFFGEVNHVTGHVFVSCSERHMHPYAGHDFSGQCFRYDILKSPVYFLMGNFHDHIRISFFFDCSFSHSPLSSFRKPAPPPESPESSPVHPSGISPL